MRFEKEQRLDPIAALNDLGMHACRERSLLLGPPQCRVVAVEHRRHAALMPMNGQEDVERTARAFDVAVERRPEPFFLVRRNERIHDDRCLGEFGIDGSDLGTPGLRVVPLGM